jgi:hypothetical protein
MIEPRIDLRPIRSLQITVGQPAGATGALRDVITRQLYMHAAEM